MSQSIAERILVVAANITPADPTCGIYLRLLAIEARQLEEAINFIVGNDWEDQQAKMEAARSSSNVVFFRNIYADQNLDPEDASN